MLGLTRKRKSLFESISALIHETFRGTARRSFNACGFPLDVRLMFRTSHISVADTGLNSVPLFQPLATTFCLLSRKGAACMPAPLQACVFSHLAKHCLSRFLLVAIVFGGSTSLGQTTVIIDGDTTIDSASPISGSPIQVVDGADGPTNVTITIGGMVAGFDALDNSQVILDGGAVSFLSSLQNNVKFVIRNGQLGCLEPVCQVIDYDSLLHADDFSTLHFFGGTVDGVLRLNDSSVAHFYGQNLALALFDDQFAIVNGQYVTGAPVEVTFHFRPDIATHIVLHNIPEPGAFLGFLALTSCLLFARIRRG
jgi:hypothetical protein